MGDSNEGTIYEKDLPGGMEVSLALRELRKSFQHGHYLSVILLSHMIIERQLVGMLHRRGLSVDRKMISVLKSAFRHGFIDGEEKRLLSDLRLLRNAYLHYCAPDHHRSLKKRASILSIGPEDILAQEAHMLMNLSEALTLR